ncbi:alkyl hydroperoxide reductase subunit F [Bacillus subtilis]|uniref:alkyl hydroperoxide reductase subunit F n=1 Tax=Pseudochrobactrum asaccharolyticum TaxID=354351 RepID=UPI001F009242|nr:alkyl hydroperoxide reductase subunit F [Pseudochrobactrum asaccharolyticum]MCF7645288.1 alkyl hydroperoxide reductase subunit F [Pseudochrobactrum asaccharolyticum]MCF7671900.1 alkyl hydroperoxide reductase subunit F [Bacillus subtilis]
MLDTNLKTQLKGYLERLVRPVEIIAYAGDDAKSLELLQLLEQIREQSDKITIKRGDVEGERTPSFALTSPGENIHLTFAGLPLGHEFTSLVLALLQVGGYPPKVEQALIDQIRGVKGTFRFETYYSLSCQNCPDVVQALNLMAVLNPGIEHVAIDGALFQDEVADRQVMSVPSIFLNGEVFGSGRMGAEEILAKIDTGAAARAADAVSAQAPFDVLVVGGGPAGAAAAIYAARKGIRTGIVADRFGGQVLDTMSIENFISVTHTEGPKLARAMETHVRDYDAEIMSGQQAVKLERISKGFKVELASGATLTSTSVILSTGARWRKMGVPGEEQYINKGVAFCPHCDGPLFKGKRIAVIGGGNSGVEAAIDLAGLVSHVTLLEFDKTLRADEVLQRKLKSLPNVTILTSAKTTEVTGDGKRVNGLVYEDRVSGEKHNVALEGVFVQIGLVPNTEWLKGTLSLNDRGEIITDNHGATSVPGVFAAGDCTTAPYKQIVIAMGEGARSSLAAFDYLIRLPAEEQAA